MDEKLIIDTNSVFIKNYIEFIKADFPQIKFETFEIEEIAFRVYLCKECLKNNKCPYCSCNPIDKMTDLYSCNHNKKFPKKHSSFEDWEKFKTANNILIK